MHEGVASEGGVLKGVEARGSIPDLLVTGRGGAKDRITG
jgi:hypothetical protein